MILAAMTLLAGGVLIGWLAASGHVAEKLQAQDKAPLKAQAASTRYEELANTPYPENHATNEGAAKLMDEQLFQRGVQSYLWSLPAVNILAMQEASEKTFGNGYNVLPIWKQRARDG
jgi:hypothetical protein